MKRIAFMLLIAFGALSCSKEDIKRLEGKVDVTVYVKDAKDNPFNGWVVYAYDQWAWEHKSTERPVFHAKSAATDKNGKAEFTLEVDHFDERETYHFVVYYTENNGVKTNISVSDKLPNNYTQKALPVTIKSKNNSDITLVVE